MSISPLIVSNSGVPRTASSRIRSKVFGPRSWCAMPRVGVSTRPFRNRQLVDIAAFKRRKRAYSTRTARMPSSIACKSAPVNWPLTRQGLFQQSLNEGTAGSHRHPALSRRASASGKRIRSCWAAIDPAFGTVDSLPIWISSSHRTTSRRGAARPPVPPAHAPEQREHRFHDILDVRAERGRLKHLAEREVGQRVQTAKLDLLGERFL